MRDLTFQQMEQIVDKEHMLQGYEEAVRDYLKLPHTTLRTRADIRREINQSCTGIGEALTRLEERGEVVKDKDDKYYLMGGE